MPPALITGLLMGAGYLSGSLLGAIWVCRAWGLRDPRWAGSGNPGFSNVLRAFGWRPALVTLIIDAVKGMPVLWVAGALSLSAWSQGLVGLGVLIGHSCPIWHRGRGGKAVASAFGVLLMLATPVALICAVCWFVLAWRVRTAAVASLSAALLAPLVSYWLVPAMTGVICVFSLLVLARHAWNIRRWRERRRETHEPSLADPLDEEDALRDRRELGSLNRPETDSLNHPETDSLNHPETDSLNHPETDSRNHSGSDSRNHPERDSRGHSSS